uniref:Bm9579 n=1 Tax=Brugia malayi TaxID=6279 RepID=A0A1I9G1E8_BRUMA|nr:Bm9579 [Brugia malayi]
MRSGGGGTRQVMLHSLRTFIWQWKEESGVSLCLPWDAKLLNEGRQLRWAGKERVGRRAENCARQGGAALLQRTVYREREGRYAD